MKSETTRIVITGAAGLVGQNLITWLQSQSECSFDIVAIDKHTHNLRILAELHPEVAIAEADLSEPGDWQLGFAEADVLVQLHAQITGTSLASFQRNNVDATRNVLAACHAHNVRYIVHASSSVVRASAGDDYTRTKHVQDELVETSGIAYCILRPTLMFGWFDPKHLGWLARFMARAPVFPIPGDGRFRRQPLYVLDFCRVVHWCLEHRPQGVAYDLVGPEKIDYIDMIRSIRRAMNVRTPLVRIPLGLFAMLLRTYALLVDRPPFTADQLRALTANDEFTGIDMQKQFGITPTPFEPAIRETLQHPRYAGVKLKGYI